MSKLYAKGELFDRPQSLCYTQHTPSKKSPATAHFSIRRANHE